VLEPEIDVTVVVCTYNRAHLLREALASLMALDTGGAFRYGLLVVDNASTDDTAAVLEAAAARSPVPFRSVHEARPGVACARNRGVKEAVGKWLAYFDDDQVADPRWLRGLLARAADVGCRCVVGENRLRDESGQTLELPPSWRVALGEQNVVNPSETAYPYKGGAGTGNLLLERRVFEEVGAFNEGLANGGEDTDLLRRVRAVTPIAFTPRAVIYHTVPPYRLQSDYLRWKMLRSGEVRARHDYRHHGQIGMLVRMVARLGKAALLTTPAWMWARVRGDRMGAIALRGGMWKAESYARRAAQLTVPRLFPQKAYFDWLQFRNERELFATTADSEWPAAPCGTPRPTRRCGG
jgi:glycosyltransferase involved in cell wall biosynthesis